MSLLVTIGAALGLFGYEAAKATILPHLTMWQSHAITIAVGSLLAGAAARQALRRQSALHQEVLRHAQSEREALVREGAIRHSETQYRQLVERSPDAVVVHRAGVVLYANPAFLRLLGAATRVAVVGRPMITWLDPDDRVRFAAQLAEVSSPTEDESRVDEQRTVDLTRPIARSPDTVPSAYRIRAVDGTWRQVDVVSVRTTEQGLPATLSIVRDMTSQREAERERARSHALLEATLEATADAILVIDRAGCLVGYNQHLLTMWALPAALAASGDTRAVMRHVCAQLADPEAFSASIHTLTAAPDAVFDDVVHFADGRIVERHSQPQRLRGETVGRVFSFRDVTERRALERALAHQAFHDPLTGLANRALLHDRMAHALARSVRDPSAGDGIAVLLIDLDHFKTVNDSLGHGAGDTILVTVGRRLLSVTRGSDTVARLGGDEFAVLLEDLANPDDAAVAAERVRSALAVPVRIDFDAVSDAAGTAATDNPSAPTRLVAISASVGIASAATAATPDALLRNVDLALYAAKGGGRARAVAFTPAMHRAAVARLDLEADLRTAVADLAATGFPNSGPAERVNDACFDPIHRCEVVHDAKALAGFTLVYQPIVDLASEQITGVEALLRWARPDGTSVSPIAFIPVAEETGLIVALGRWVLASACQQAVAWEALGPQAHVAVSVNVSGRQLQEVGFVDDVQAVLDATGLAPRRLVLEITESVMMRDPTQTLASLRALKALGVRLAIDDFGTGYSSLAYLRQFPVDVLKIDKTFIDGVGHGGDENVLATAIVSLGAALALTTVAEGIEDVAQLARLRALGCQRGQGYLFARPMPPDAVANQLAAGQNIPVPE